MPNLFRRILPGNRRNIELMFDVIGFEAIESENILKHVITCDELWLFEYDPETKHQSMQWVGEGKARPKKARMSKSQVKTMLVAFFDKKDLIHKEFLPQKTTMNEELYLNIFRHLRE